MPKAKYVANYKNTLIVPGILTFGDIDRPHPEYNNLSVGLRVSDKVKEKFIKWAKPQVKDWADQNGGKKPQGLTIKAAQGRDGEPQEGHLITFKRKGEINGQTQKIRIVDIDGQPTDVVPGPGSKIQVKVYLYLSATATGTFVRAEPQTIRVVEYAEQNDTTDWEEAEEDFVSTNGDAPEDSAGDDFGADDEEDFV
jgi:hypothetical protein